MKCEIIIDKDCDEKVVVYAKKQHRLVQEIQQLAETASAELIGYRDREIIRLHPSDMECVTVVNGKVYAVCEDGQWLLKSRLYLLEETLPPQFVRINQSCIANIQRIERFDASFSGTLTIRFKSGYTDYVSRTQLKTVKEKVGI